MKNGTADQFWGWDLARSHHPLTSPHYLASTVGCLYVSCPLPDPVSHPEEGVISRTVEAGAHLL